MANKVDNDPKWTQGEFNKIYNDDRFPFSHDSSAWTKTQPKPVFRSVDEEEEKKD
jgi:hypothetical protein